MEIRFAPYVLHARASLSAKAISAERAGALLRIETAEGIGFADVHPWTELGDAPLAMQLKSLANGELTPLTKCSLFLAELDRQSRARKQSAFEDLSIPASHFLISDLTMTEEHAFERLREDGFRTLKIKMGRDLAVETQVLRRLAGTLTSFRLRFDFNEGLTVPICLEWWSSLPSSVREAVDFLEDPVLWNENDWRVLQANRVAPLARDRAQTSDQTSDQTNEFPEARVFDWLVIKPAVQEAELLAQKAAARSIRLAVTSYLDHPVGQVGAALVAARLKERDERNLMGDCGLVSHYSFEKNEFSEALAVEGACLSPPNGFGIGFDDLLERREWKPLV